MDDSSNGDVLLVGQSQPLQEMLTQLVRQCGASAKSLAAWEDCANALRSEGCRLLVIEGDGDATSDFQVLAESRGISPQMPILVLVEHGDIPTAVRAMKAGATDCLEKPVAIEKLRSTVEVLVRQGASTRSDPGAVLTKTECLVLVHILEGRPNRETADILHRSTRTIETHRRRIMRKLGASNVVHLVRQAAIMGLVDPERRGTT